MGKVSGWGGGQWESMKMSLFLSHLILESLEQDQTTIKLSFKSAGIMFPGSSIGSVYAH